MFTVIDRQRKTLEGHFGEVTALRFLVDSDKLVSGSINGEVLLWDVDDATLLHRFDGHLSRITGLAITLRDEEILGSSLEGHTLYWKIPKQRGGHGPTVVQSSHTYPENGKHLGVQVTSDDGLVVIPTQSNITIYNLGTQARIVGLIEHSRGVKDLCVSSDNRFIASCGGDNAIFLMPLSENKVAARYKGHTKSVHALDLHPSDEQLASGGLDGTIRIWNTVKHKLVKLIRTFNDTVLSVKYSSDGCLLAAASMDSSLGIFNTVDWQLLQRVHSQGAWASNYSHVFINKNT